jgi:hypothetical protein
VGQNFSRFLRGEIGRNAEKAREMRRNWWKLLFRPGRAGENRRIKEERGENLHARPRVELPEEEIGRNLLKGGENISITTAWREKW